MKRAPEVYPLCFNSFVFYFQFVFRDLSDGSRRFCRTAFDFTRNRLCEELKDYKKAEEFVEACYRQLPVSKFYQMYFVLGSSILHCS
jgi:hypothetical protein